MEGNVLSENQTDIWELLRKDLNSLTLKIETETKSKPVNFFKILKLEDMEIRHSNFLAWLLDPNENHKIGNLFLKSILEYFKCEDENNKLNYDECSVKRENEFIDILIELPKSKFVIIIENKIWSGENGSQLSVYHDRIGFKDYKKLFIYLSPYGKEPINEVDKKNWKIFDYTKIYVILKDIYKAKKNEMKDEVKLIINNYLEVLEETIMNKDNKVIKECVNFYFDHSKIIDQINKYKPDYKRRKEMIQTILNNKNWTLEGDSYLFMMSNDLRNFFIGKGLNKDFIYSAINNNVNSGSAKNISVILNNTNPNYMEKFFNAFQEHFKQKKVFGGSSIYRTLINYNLLELSEYEASEDEKEQEMENNLNIFLDIEFPKIADFIMNYNFDDIIAH